MVIEFPKGRYELIFCRRLPRAAAPAIVAPAANRWRPGAAACLAITFIVCILAAAVLVSDRKTHAATKPGLPQTVQRIWARYLSGARPVLISIATPMFVHHRIGHTGVFFRHPDLNSWSDVERFEPYRKVVRALNTQHSSPSFIYTGVGEAAGAFILARLFASQGREARLHLSNMLSSADMKDNNIVVLGAAENYPVAGIPFERAFLPDGGKIRNVRPAKGERSVYKADWPRQRSRKITRLCRAIPESAGAVNSWCWPAVQQSPCWPRSNMSRSPTTPPSYAKNSQPDAVSFLPLMKL